MCEAPKPGPGEVGMGGKSRVYQKSFNYDREGDLVHKVKQIEGMEEIAAAMCLYTNGSA